MSLETVQQSGKHSEIIERGDSNPMEYDVNHNHDYVVKSPMEYADQYFAGFVVRRIESWTSCEECRSSVSKKSGNLERDAMINCLSKGYLKYPSDLLYKLLSSLERAILQTLFNEKLQYFTFMHIARKVYAESITFVGCEEHKEWLTKTVIHYYLIARSRMITKRDNKANDEQRRKERELRKRAILVTKKSNPRVN